MRQDEVIADFGVYIGEAGGGFQPADLLLVVGEEDCLETNLLSVEAKLTRLLSTQAQVRRIVLRLICSLWRPS